MDADLAILGKPPGEFERYERGIRKEYGHVPRDVFEAGRSAVLRELLGRPQIYVTAHFARLYEMAARENLGRSLAGLGAGV